MSAFAASRASAGFGLALRFAARELRGGLKGFRIFVACIALGVMAIAGVNSVSRAMTGSIAEEGQSILGGDIAFSLQQRQASPEQRAFLASYGAVSEIATLRGMARKPGTTDQALVELKSIDGAYPLYGALVVEGGGDPAALLAPNAEGVPGALVEATLPARLGVGVGDVLSIGSRTVRIAGVIATEPDKLAGGLGFGPRLMVSNETLAASGLVQPGSLVRWHYRVRMAGAADAGALKAFADAAEARFPEAGWEVRSRANATPGLARQIERFALFLTLVGLTALIVGGVGVANAVKAYLDGKREVIATFKCLGASGGFVFQVYLLQIVAIAGVGIAVGLVAGAAIPWLAGLALADVLPIRAHASVYPSELALAAVYGLLTALAFALWPLGRAHDVPPTALFRERAVDARGLPRRRYLAATVLVVAALAALAIGLAFDPRLATIYALATAFAFLMLRAVAGAVMALARRAPRPRSTEWRLALGNIHRPGALTPAVVLSLGLGLALLVALALIDGNLRRQLAAEIPSQAPSFFFLDVPSRDAAAFDALLAEAATGAKVDRVAMMRGRIVSVKGVRAEAITAPPNVAWALQGDRGITYSDTVPVNSELVAGSWWAADYAGPPLVSMDREIAEGLGLALGDKLEVNVLGRTFEVTLANMRRVKWESMGINFVMVFTPATFRGAPHSGLATVTWPGGGSNEQELALLSRVAQSFPGVTSIRVKEALAQVNELVGQIATGIRVAALVALVTSVLVLAGALASGQRQRGYEAVVLKTLGATRRRVMTAYLIEFGLLGLATAVFGLAAGAGAAWFVTAQIMGIGFSLLPSVALGAVAAALVATIGFGLAGTWSTLGAKSAPVLRNL